MNVSFKSRVSYLHVTSTSTCTSFLNRIPQLRSTESARRHPSAAKSMGLCLWANINQRCCEGMLSFIAMT